MESITLTTRVDANGNLSVKMPDSFANQIVEIVVKSKHEPTSHTEESWSDFVNRMYGISADDPIERGVQGVFEVREEFAG